MCIGCYKVMRLNDAFMGIVKTKNIPTIVCRDIFCYLMQ